MTLHADAVDGVFEGGHLFMQQVSFAPRQLLHAARMRVTHPRTGRELVLEAPLPDDFQQALERLGIAEPRELPSMTQK